MSRLQHPGASDEDLRIECESAAYRMDWDWFKGRFGKELTALERCQTYGPPETWPRYPFPPVESVTVHERAEADEFFRRLNLHIRWERSQALEHERLKASSDAGPALQTT